MLIQKSQVSVSQHLFTMGNPMHFLKCLVLYKTARHPSGDFLCATALSPIFIFHVTNQVLTKSLSQMATLPRC